MAPGQGSSQVASCELDYGAAEADQCGHAGSGLREWLEVDGPPPLPGAGVGAEPQRWSALVIYFTLCCTQGLAWATFSAVPVSVTRKFFVGDEISKFTVDLLLNWGLILFVPALVPAMWLHAQRARGLLLALKYAAALTAGGCLVRCYPSVWCAHVGQALIGIAGPLVWNACASFSSAWFPPEERTFATALGGGASFLGPGVQFLVVLPVSSGERFAWLLQAEAAFACSVCLAVFTLLPAKPRRPPSMSAAAHVGDSKAAALDTVKAFGADLRAVASSRDCWLVGLAAGVSSGIYSVYSSSFPVVLDRDEGEFLSKWLGFSSIMAFVLGSLLVGLLSERRFARRLKALLLGLIAAGLVGVAVFSLALPSPLSLRGLVKNEPLRFASVAVLSAAMGGVFPVAIELAAELVYPAEESTVVGAITSINNMSGMVYLLLMDRIPNTDVNLPCLAALLFALLLVCFSDERYVRRDADDCAVDH